VGEQRARRALRAPLATRVARIAIPTALAGVVATGVIVAVSPGQTQIAYPANTVNLAVASPSSSASVADRHRAGSRAVTSARPSLAAPSVAKVTAEPKPKPKVKAPAPQPALKVTGVKYATIALSVRTKPAQKADVVAVVKARGRVSVTNTVRDGYRYISFNGKGRWVKNKYLVNKLPKPAAKAAATSGGISGKPCASGSKMESGLTSDAIKVHRALCARFPQVKSYGGTRSGGGNHGSGRAVDAMISNTAVGTQMANWLRANAKRLGISEVIYRQRIWTVQRSSEGWRGMSDRGSATANHYDHVHISVYGNRASG